MRLVCMGDTHGYHRKLTIPDGDLLIHAGDFSMRAETQHVVEFAAWFTSLPHEHKIMIPGNHDMACEDNPGWAAEEFAPAHYLDHKACEIMGYTIFGSPYSTAIHNPSYWAFDYEKDSVRSRRIWNSIPDNIDILITHGPPYGIGDRVKHPRHNEDPCVGDKTLLERVKKIQPRVHIFGHIHEGYGVYHPDYVDMFGYDNQQDFNVGFYNVCVCDVRYNPVNPITVIDL